MAKTLKKHHSLSNETYNITKSVQKLGTDIMEASIELRLLTRKLWDRSHYDSVSQTLFPAAWRNTDFLLNCFEWWLKIFSLMRFFYELPRSYRNSHSHIVRPRCFFPRSVCLGFFLVSFEGLWPVLWSSVGFCLVVRWFPARGIA